MHQYKPAASQQSCFPGAYLGVLWTLTVWLLARSSAPSATAADIPKLRFDRAQLHAQAVQESLQPIRPGIVGQTPFWNRRSRQFMYAPAFEFHPVAGAPVYRFIVTAYGQGWKFVAKEPNASLEPIWQDLPDGQLVLWRIPLGLERSDVLRLGGPAEYKDMVFEKKPGMKPLSCDLPAVPGASAYQFSVRQLQTLTFEADHPWAPLTPIWHRIPPGKVVLSVAALDRPGGKVLGYARLPNGHASLTFERKAVFNGPYHEPASDYAAAGERWLRWLATGTFQRWVKEGDPQRLGQFPCKHEVAAIFGLTQLARRERDAALKEQWLQRARHAARTLIRGSFPAEWQLAHLPPTYNKSRGNYAPYHAVMMHYPADAGLAYLDLFEATGDKEFFDAAVRIAEVYRRTQLPNGTWPLLLDGRTGEKFENCRSYVIPCRVIDFLERLITQYRKTDYQPVVQAAWRWIETDVLANFRFEGQFEDTTASGNSDGNLSGVTAMSIAAYLLRHRKDNPNYLSWAEEALRFAEDQFVIWEQPPHPEQFTPCVLEQYRYMVSVQAIAAHFMSVYVLAYEATGKELYLAKAVTLANAFTVLQKASGGSFVNTYWTPVNTWGDWPNCHEFSARKLLELADFLASRAKPQSR
ncbi:MAG: hypothetical protein NZM42_09700 [Gemmatales bacterium]|nr:hypothetical protein [Gemmatales bacterium]MDW8221483.1 hypothetical protein [Gemmatales bacterium]